MRICLIAPDIRTLGGYELQLTALVTGLAQRGHDVHLFVRDTVQRDHPYWQQIVAAGVRAKTTPAWLRHITPKRFGEKRWVDRVVQGGTPLWAVLAWPLAKAQGRSFERSKQAVSGVVHRLLSAVARIDPQQWWLNRQLDWLWATRPPHVVDIQHSMIPAGLLYAKRRNATILYTEYGAPNEALRSVWTPMRDLVNEADFVIGRADASLSGLRELCNLRADMPTMIVPNAVTAGPTDGASAELPNSPNVTLLAIGRISAEKAPFTLLDAFQKLHAQQPSTSLVYAGDGPLRPQLEQAIAAQKLQDAVQVTGKFATLEPHIRAADFVVHPTLNDGRSVAVLEAMAWGRPVVGTRVGGVAELIDDGVTGLLVEPNQADQLAEALLTVANNRSLRVEMGQAARARFLQGSFSAEALVDKTVQAYEIVITSKQPINAAAPSI